MGTATVDLKYRPARAAQVAPSGARVNVAARDVRTENTPYIGRRVGDFGNKLGPIASKRPVEIVVRDAVAAELGLRGYTIVPDGRQVQVDVLSFYNDNKVVPLVVAINTGQVRLAVTVKDASGGVLYSREIAGSDGRANSGVPGSTAASLSRSLQRALTQLMSDQAFLAALNKA